MLGAELVGTYSYTYSITNYFVLFATSGMSIYGVRTMARAGERREDRTRVFWSVYGSQVVIGLVVLACYAIYVAVMPQGGLVIALIWGMWVLSAVLDISWLLFGLGEFKVPAVRGTIVRLVQLVGVFLLVRSHDDLWVYVALISGGFLVNQLAIWPFANRYVGFYRPRWAEVRAHFKPNFVLFVPVIAASLYLTLDKIFLGAMSSMTEVGYFEYSEKVSRLPLTVILALGTVMLPKMSEVLASGDRARGLELVESSMWVMQAAAFAFAFGIAGVGREFVPIFFGKGFIAATPLVILLSAIIPIIAASNVLGRQYLIPTMRDRLYTVSICAGAAVNVALNLLLIPHLAALGTAIGTVAAEVTVLVVQAMILRHELPLATYVKSAAPFFAIGACMFAIIRLSAVVLVMVGIGATAMGLVMEILVGGIFYLAASYAYCRTTHNEQFARLFGPLLMRMRR